ncbi:MAG: hypothetical protein R3F59_38830 [Myxococcota bacterium]
MLLTTLLMACTTARYDVFAEIVVDPDAVAALDAEALDDATLALGLHMDGGGASYTLVDGFEVMDEPLLLSESVSVGLGGCDGHELAVEAVVLSADADFDAPLLASRRVPVFDNVAACGSFVEDVTLRVDRVPEDAAP